MSIDFYQLPCQEATDEVLFGLRDDQEGEKAYVDPDNSNRARWVAVVENPERLLITFTAIDYCIEITRLDGTMESRCDGMLTYTDGIVFVELKEIRVGGWIPGGVEQLKRSVEIYALNHDLSAVRKKRAFLANRKFPRFQYGQQEVMSRFKHETGVRLIIHNVINVP